jgi:hypothetical protein
MAATKWRVAVQGFAPFANTSFTQILSIVETPDKQPLSSTSKTHCLNVESCDQFETISQQNEANRRVFEFKCAEQFRRLR